MKKNSINNLITIFITALFIFIVVHNIDFAVMTETFKDFNIKYLFVLIMFFLLIMTLRAKRWEILLPKGKYSFYSLYEIYMTSNLMNVFLPARAGDIFRGCYFGKKHNLSKMNILGTVLAERILDGLTVVGILIVGLLSYHKSQMIINLTIIATIMFVVSFLFVLWVYKYNKIDDLCNLIKKCTKFLPNNFYLRLCNLIDKLNPHFVSFFKGFETFNNPKTFAASIFYSIASWAGDCIFIYLLVLAFGLKIGFVVAFFIVSFISLSTIIPSSSIYIGPYQYAFILALSLFNIDKSVSLSIAILQQAIMLVSYIIIALGFVLRNHIKLKDIKSEG